MQDPTSFPVPISAKRVCIIDDEPSVVTFLEEALKDRYDTATAATGNAAIALIEKQVFDILVIDLVLPDMTGIDILKFAKTKDEFVEVIIITGYASLDSAADAINRGASSYLIKPLQLDEFIQQIDRAAANRAFHLKSLMLMDHVNVMTPDVKDHVHDITTLYRYSRRLLLSMEFPEILKIVLQDVNERASSYFCAVGVNFLDFAEMFAMPRFGPADEQRIRELLLRYWAGAFDILDRAQFEENAITLSLFDGLKGDGAEPKAIKTVSIPMIVKGRTIGSLTIFMDTGVPFAESEYNFLYVYTSLISALIEHAYMDMQAQLLAKTDSMTGIANYRMFHETLDREISRSNRMHIGFALVLMDLDDFKKINDTYGHLAGNDVLKDISHRINAIIRKQDQLARYGGEEFALLLPDTAAEGALMLAERIRQEIAAGKLSWGHQEITYTVSMGIACYHGDTSQPKDILIANADRALYLSKSKGKNCVTVA